MGTDSISRVNYFDKQYLRTEDFSDEQAYHLEMRRRHNLAHHRWGIVHGLNLMATADGIILTPGVAVDGYGRELILAEGLSLSTDEFDAKAGEKLDVWLYYHRRGSDTAPAGFNSCDEQLREAYYRWREMPRVQLEKPQPGPTRAREPDAVPADLLDAAPYRKPIDDPVDRWPVYLGRVFRDLENAEQPYRVDLSGRPYVGLVGERIDAPSGRASMTLGKKIYLNDEGLPSSMSTELAVEFGKEPKRRTHLRLNSKGVNLLGGKTTVEGDLRVADGRMAFEMGAVGLDEAPNCEDVYDQPWSIYRVACKRPSQANPGAMELIQQLRIEMGSDSPDQEVVIGCWSADDKAFKPTLTIKPGGVIVHGNLVVKGTISNEEAPASGHLTQQAQSFLTSTFSSGVVGANLQLPKFYKSPYEGGIDLATEEGRQAALEILLNNPGSLSSFVDLMLEESESRDVIIPKLFDTNTYRHSVMEYLRDNTVPLDRFSALLQVSSYNSTLPEFAESIVTTDAGRRAILNAMSASSARLNHFTALLELDEYNDRHSEFAESLVFTEHGANTIGESLVGNPNHLSEMLAYLIAEETTRDILRTDLLSDSNGRLSVAEFLVNPTTDPAWLSEVVNQIVDESSGRKAMADGLEADSDRAEGFANLDWDAALTWDADYPTLAAALRAVL